MGDFKKAYQVGRVNEGGYVNRADDAGGETYCGVSRVFHPDWAGWPIVDAYKANHELKRGDVIADDQLEQLLEEFYRAEFWEKCAGDDITLDSVSTYIYDWSLTSGGAKKAIQEALQLKADGVFGPKTIAAINAKGVLMLSKVRDIRIQYYYELVKTNPKQVVNLKGWLNRATKLYEELK